MKIEISKYIAEISRLYKSGAATEHSYRSALENLLKVIVSPMQVTNEPKRIECGAPDLIVTRGEVPVGYVEAKDIGADLNSKQYKEQFDRYKQALDNLIITDYLKFIFFENGEYKTEISIANVQNNEIKGKTEKFEDFVTLILLFSRHDGQKIKTSGRLSKVMASKARLMANIIENSYTGEASAAKTSIYNQLKSFREALIPNISNKDFSDIYAQTIAYGMFAAKINYSQHRHCGLDPQSPFNRTVAAQQIPQSNPFLRKLFQYIAGFDLDKRIRWVVDDLADLFNHVDIAAIIKEFSKAEHDPIIHFYETFLAQYDPALRKSRGVWYTPQPVVKFIVQAVDDILKNDFGLSKGLADNSLVETRHLETRHATSLSKMQHRVQILDPATGTGTFLAEVVKNIYKNFSAMQGAWQSYVRDHLIPRLNGFEIIMASYVMAHLKLELLLQQTGYKHPEDERLRIYLTNSLDEAREISEIPYAQWLYDEASEASQIKRDAPVMVVLGNPPYSGISQNNSSWITEKIEDYKYVDGKHFKERKHWLHDDYVKFIRLGQHMVNKSGEGVLAYINNHGFLDNPTFRGMRWNLLKTFDKIYVIDLHGNVKKKETTPDGSKDENVFDIQQGVSINLFVKHRNNDNKKTHPLATVFHTEIYGKRSDKYDFLLNNTLSSLPWQRIEIKEPHFFFIPKTERNKHQYEKGFAINEMFKLNVTGIVTARDALVIDFDEKTLLSKINKFCDTAFNDDYVRNWLFPNKTNSKYLVGDTRGWKIADARKKIRNNCHEKHVVDFNYRPFDIRKIYYSPDMVDWGRENIMQNFLKGENVGLVIGRQAITNNWSHIQVTNTIIDNRIHYSNKGIPILMPLYLYIKNGIADNDKRQYHKQHNLNKNIITKISIKLGLQFTEEKEDNENTFAPIDVLDYIYAVLHSPAYREKYKEFLKIDFPRVPYPQNAAQFWRYVSFGAQLRRLHLMENIELLDDISVFPIADGNEVDSMKRIDDRVFINDTQYFDNVPLEAWNFYIGGYQPAQKWLKDRKGKILNFDDIEHYRKIIHVLMQTDTIMTQIDEI